MPRRAKAIFERTMPEQHSILVVEGEPLIAMMLEDFLESLGHRVHTSCGSVRDAMEAIDKTQDGEVDLAILDVNLNGETAWPVARKLRERRIPFVLATGGHVEQPPAEFASVPVIEKPYTVDRVNPALEAALAG